jgi:hypothetical protein
MIQVVCFHKLDRHTVVPNPYDSELIEQLFIRHKQGWSTSTSYAFVSPDILANKDSWL